MVRADRRHQARTGAVSRRRAGDQRSSCRSCETWVARVDSSHPALQGRHAAAAGAIDREALASLPDVPTYQEAGIKGLVLDQWLGVFVPAGTPPPVATRLNAEINRALADAPIRDSFMQSAQEPIGGSAGAFAGLVRDEFAKYERLVKELNIKAAN